MVTFLLEMRINYQDFGLLGVSWCKLPPLSESTKIQQEKVLRRGGILDL